jgi:long-chain fatty acid transport protein
LSIRFRLRLVPITAAVASALACAGPVHASGFSVPEISVAGVSMANALVANPDEIGAFAFNPAAIAFHDESSIAAGSVLIGPRFSVETASGSHDTSGADWLAAPIFQLALRLNDKWSAGFGVSAPFGLETRWETNTFPPLTGTAPLPSPPFPPGASIPLSPQPTQSKLEVLDISPTVAYRINDNLAVSAGADIYWAKSAQLNSTLTAAEGDGSGWGFNLSALYVKDAFSAGINFHSAATVEIEGTYTALNPTLVALGALQPSQTGELDLDLPWRLQLGARYEFTPRLAVELDWTRTGWSEFEQISMRGDLSGAPVFVDENNWEDVNAYRIGVTYDLLSQTQLRFGYAFDETGQPDEYFSPRVPDADRHLFGIGVAHRLSDGWQVEAGYMYVMMEDRTVTGSRPYTGGGDINGTTAIAGEYDAHAHLIGLEISKSFAF